MGDDSQHGGDSQQGDESLVDLSLFLFDKALTISFLDECLSSRDARLVSHKCPQDDVRQKELQEKAVEKIVHEIESMMKELKEKLDQPIISTHPLVVEALAEMVALEMRLFEIQSSVMDLVDTPRNATNTNPLYPGTTDPYELLRFDCKRLANSYLHPLETLSAKMRLTSGLGVESSHLEPSRETQSINTEHHKHQAKLARREAVRTKVIEILQERWADAHGRYTTPRVNYIVDIMYLEIDYRPDWPEGIAPHILSRTLRDDISAILKETDVDKFRPTD